MRKKIVLALTAVALSSGAAAGVAPIAQASPAAPLPAVSAAPAVAAVKTTKTIVVEAKSRANPEKLTVKQARKMKSTFIEAKGSAFDELGFPLLIGIKKGPASAAKLWKAKKGQKVRIITAKGKKLNVKVLKRVSGEDFAEGNLPISLAAKTKAIVVLGATVEADNARVFLLG